MLVLAWPVMYPLAGARSLKKATGSHEPFYPPERSSRFAKVSLDMSGDGLKDEAALVIDRARHHSGLGVCFAKKEPTLPPNCHILVDDDLEDSYDDMGLVVCPPGLSPLQHKVADDAWLEIRCAIRPAGARPPRTARHSRPTDCQPDSRAGDRLWPHLDWFKAPCT